MRLEPTTVKKDFRQSVQQFVARTLPADIREKIRQGRRLGRDELTAWYRMLDTRGWATPRWPQQAGGAGWTEAQHAIFDEELQLNDAPRMVFPGIMMLGPTLIESGTDEQKARYLPHIRSSATWWAQGFSESEAGSDLAAVGTMAEFINDASGPHYVIPGRKLWTSCAHFCDMMFCLARTNSVADRPQRGLSLLLLDMNAPGVSLRWLRTIDGGDDLNEVTLDRVRVPVADRLGAEGEGWTYAKYLLGFERGGITGVGSAKKLLLRLQTLHAIHTKRGPTSRLLGDQISKLYIEVLALEATANRLLAQASSDLAAPSILKIGGTELRQKLTRILLQYAKPSDVYPAPDETLPHSDCIGATANPALTFLEMRKLSIYGGTNEIQRNIIAKQIFGD